MYDIVGTPLQIDLRFVPALGGTPPPSGHLLGGPSGAILRAALKGQLAPDQAAALDEVLTQPLDEVFHTLWESQRASIAEKVTRAIKDEEESAYDIVPVLPARGTLRAQLHEYGTYSEAFDPVVPEGVTATQLSLLYDVTGVRVTFEVATDVLPDPGMELTFDARIGLFLLVFAQPQYEMHALADFQVLNTDLSSASLYSGIVVGLRNLYLDAMQTPFVPPGEPITPLPVSDLSGFQDRLRHMSEAVAMAGLFGFGDVVVSIDTADGPPAVRLTLTHPFDPAPGIGPGFGGYSDMFVPLTRWATEGDQVSAGGQLAFSGTSFTVREPDAIDIIWGDTTSGKVRETEIQHGTTGPDGTTPAEPQTVKLPRRPYDGVTFRATGLKPDTAYSFRVRHYDIPGLVATQWSQWLVVRTGLSDKVQIVLDDPAQTQVGEATVDDSGNIRNVLTVPAHIPAGRYDLWAVMAGARVAKADRPIEVLAPTVVTPPSVTVLNSSGGPFQPGLDRMLHGRPFDVRGANFRPGLVDLFVDVPGGHHLGQAQAGEDGSWHLRTSWTGYAGYHRVVAVQGDLQATSVDLNIITPPR